MNRRAFLNGVAASAVAAPGLAALARAQTAAAAGPGGRVQRAGGQESLVMDAMGELRPEYDDTIIHVAIEDRSLETSLFN